MHSRLFLSWTAISTYRPLDRLARMSCVDFPLHATLFTRYRRIYSSFYQRQMPGWYRDGQERREKKDHHHNLHSPSASAVNAKGRRYMNAPMIKSKIHSGQTKGAKISSRLIVKYPAYVLGFSKHSSFPPSTRLWEIGSYCEISRV